MESTFRSQLPSFFILKFAVKSFPISISPKLRLPVSAILGDSFIPSPEILIVFVPLAALEYTVNNTGICFFFYWFKFYRNGFRLF